MDSVANPAMVTTLKKEDVDESITTKRMYITVSFPIQQASQESSLKSDSFHDVLFTMI